MRHSPSRPRPLARAAVALAVPLLLAACGDDPTAPGAPEQRLDPETAALVAALAEDGLARLVRSADAAAPTAAATGALPSALRAAHRAAAAADADAARAALQSAEGALAGHATSAAASADLQALRLHLTALRLRLEPAAP